MGADKDFKFPTDAGFLCIEASVTASMLRELVVRPLCTEER